MNSHPDARGDWVDICTYAFMIRGMLVNKLTALDAVSLRKLKRFAKQSGKSVNELIREAVSYYLKANGQ